LYGGRRGEGGGGIFIIIFPSPTGRSNRKEGGEEKFGLWRGRRNLNLPASEGREILLLWKIWKQQLIDMKRRDAGEMSNSTKWGGGPEICQSAGVFSYIVCQKKRNQNLSKGGKKKRGMGVIIRDFTLRLNNGTPNCGHEGEKGEWRVPPSKKQL